MSNLPGFWRANLAQPFDRFFEDFGVLAPRRTEAEMGKYGFNPQCEVSEDKSNYLMKFDLPGIPKDQIKIELNENQLTVSGERKEEKKEDSKRRHFSEMFYGSFARSFTFPTPIDSEKTVANYDHGVLTITVPKSESNRARQISVR